MHISRFGSVASRHKVQLGAALSAVALAVTGLAVPNATAAPKPITIGISVSLSGDFSGDGKATQQGYKIWATWQIAHG